MTEDLIVIDSGAVATEVIRRQIARIEVIDVQRTDLDMLNSASEDWAQWQGWFLLCLGMLLPTVISALTVDWNVAPAYVPGVYVSACITLGLGTLFTGVAWRRARSTKDTLYRRIVGNATIEVRQRIVR